MKQLFKLISIMMIVAMCLSGCSQKPAVSNDISIVEYGDNKAESYKIVATSFYGYDIARELLKDSHENFGLTLLLSNKSDYLPTQEVIDKFTDADIIIHSGTESDSWVEDIVNQYVGEETAIINLFKETPTEKVQIEGTPIVLNGIEISEEVITEGMDAIHSHTCDNIDTSNIHLSIDAMIKYTDTIYKSISALEYNIEHEINYNNYLSELNILKSELLRVINGSMCQPLVIEISLR